LKLLIGISPWDRSPAIPRSSLSLSRAVLLRAWTRHGVLVVENAR